MLYMKLLKGLYMLLRLALIFYNKVQDELEELRFTINPYDTYVANKMVNESQLTVIWHVDDFKVSHKDIQVVTNFISDLQKIMVMMVL